MEHIGFKYKSLSCCKTLVILPFLIILTLKYSKNTVKKWPKMSKNDKNPKFSKIDFCITVVDMKTGVGSHEITPFGHVLTYLSPIHHPHSKSAPGICQNCQKSSFLLYFLHKSENPHFGQHLLTKIMLSIYHENTVLGYYGASKFNASQESGSRGIPSLRNTLL